MQIFTLSKDISIVCESLATRTAFKHEATLMINGHSFDKAKICYQNRTWEVFQFQSVLRKLISGSDRLTKAQKQKAKTKFSL